MPERHRRAPRPAAGFRQVRLSQVADGWRAEATGLGVLSAPSVAELGHLVRERLGDQPWAWRCDLGQDTDWYVELVHHHHGELGNAVLSSREAAAQLADAVWALRLGVASAEDCAEVLGVPLEWVRQVWC